MDIPKQKKKSLFINKRNLILIVLLMLVGCIYLSLKLSSQNYEVSQDDIQISTVTTGMMPVEIKGNGVLVPKNISLISNNVAGRIEAVLVKAGSVVKNGDVIIEMVNSELEQETIESEWTLEAAEAKLLAILKSHENNLLDEEANKLQVKHSYDKALLKFKAEERLYVQKTGAVSKIDYERSKLDVQQYRQTLQIQIKKLVILKESQEAQYNAEKASFNALKNKYARLKYLMNSLKVVATKNGTIQDVDIEVGQRISVGSKIAKLAQQGELIAELDIPERQIRDVEIGQRVIIKTANNKINGVVLRIDPGVRNGTVQVDVNLEGDIPPEARPDLSIQGTIEVSSSKRTLFVTRPSYAQADSQGTLFKVSVDGNSATRVPVKFGTGSANNIEILEGLSEGDRIITSDTNAWAHLEKIQLTKELL